MGCFLYYGTLFTQDFYFTLNKIRLQLKHHCYSILFEKRCLECITHADGNRGHDNVTLGL